MNKVIIEVTVNDIHEYRNEPWFEYVKSLIMDESDWKEQVINDYPQPSLLRQYWDSVMSLFVRHLLSHEDTSNYRKGSVNWLIRHIDSINSARAAFKQFIKPNTITGQSVLNNFNHCRNIEFTLGMGDPLDLNGHPVRFNRKGKWTSKVGKDGRVDL